MLQPLVEHRLELAGFGTRALELEGEGPPVLLLHGYSDSADTWRLMLDLLARRDRRALALDLPGYGHAGPLRDGEPVLEQYRAFAAAAVEHLAEAAGEQVVVVGNSLGGCVALRAGEQEELPIAGVVPIAPAGFDHPVWFRAIEADPFVRTLLRAPVPVPGPLVRAVVGQVYRTLAFAAPRSADPGVVAAFCAHHGSRKAVAGHLANGRRLLGELDHPFALERVRAPVLLIWGDHDRMVSHSGSRHVLEALPGTEYVLLEGVGHCPQLEAPGRVVDAMEAALIGWASSTT